MQNRKIALMLAAAILSGVTGCSAQKPSEKPSVSSEITSSVSSSSEISAN